MDERLKELQKEISLKGFRPGKVPPEIIKSQFGKSIYGEVVDKILRETTSKWQGNLKSSNSLWGSRSGSFLGIVCAESGPAPRFRPLPISFIWGEYKLD